MSSRSAVPTALPSSTATRRGSPREQSGQAHDAATEQVSCRPLSALAFAARCHAGQRRESDGAPYIEHLSEVARLLRDAGCSDALVAAGLLHGVLQDTDVSAAELRARFGVTVCELVQATTDDSVGSYPQRMHALREQVRAADRDAALLFAANEVARVRELADEVRRDRARIGAYAARDRARGSLERYQQMRLREYHASLAMLRAVVPQHRLVRQLARELETCPVSMRRPPRVSAEP
jgi:hypothetical protein